MPSSSINIFDQGTKPGVYNRGFRPELYTVPAGTYASNGVYGVGATLAHSYLSIQEPRGTTTIPLGMAAGPPFVISTEGCEIRQHGRNVDFIISVCLDATTDPVYGTEELKFRPKQILPGQPGRYMIPFPLSERSKPEPVFDDIEIDNKFSIQIGPDEGPDILYRARLLRDGTLALLKKNVGGLTNDKAVTHDDIVSGFDPDNAIFFTIRGSYKAETSLPTR